MSTKKELVTLPSDAALLCLLKALIIIFKYSDRDKPWHDWIKIKLSARVRTNLCHIFDVVILANQPIIT